MGLLAALKAAVTPAPPQVVLPGQVVQHTPRTARWAILAMIGCAMMASLLVALITIWVLYGNWGNHLRLWEMRFDLVHVLALGGLAIVGITQLAMIISVIHIANIVVQGPGGASVSIQTGTEAPAPQPAAKVTTIVEAPAPTPAPQGD